MNVDIWEDGQPYVTAFQKWWSHYNGFPISERLLSTSGVAILDDLDHPLAVAHLYPTKGSNLLYVNYCARDPRLPRHESDLALRTLAKGLEASAKLFQYEFLYMISDKLRLNEILRENGYFEGSQCTEFLKEVRHA